MMLRRLLAVAFAMLVLALMFRLLPWDQIDTLKMPFRSFDVRIFLLSIVLTFITQILRAYRLRPHLHGDRPVSLRLVCVLNVASFLNTIMPFRSGELGFLYLSRKYLHVDWTTSASSLLIVRVADLIAMSFYFTLALFIRFGKATGTGGKEMYALLALSLLLIFSLLFYHIGKVMRLGLRVVFSLMTRLKLSSLPLVQSMKRQQAHWLHQLEQVKQPRLLVRTLSLSLAIFLLVYLTVLLLFYTFDFPALAHELNTAVEVDLITVIIAISCVGLAIVLPMNIVANLGTYEAGWMFAFVGLLGWGAALSTIMALWTHALGLVTLCFDAGVSWLYLRWSRRAGKH